MPSTPLSAAPGTPPGRTVTLPGWGRIAPSTATWAEPPTAQAAAELLGGTPKGAVIARGLGRSYNNAAQSAGGTVISTARLNRIICLDPETGIVTAQAGVSLE